LRNYLDVPKVSLFTNGHLALELVLQAFNLSGEVITTPFTFASTTHAIVRNNLQPVFCDINMDDCTIDVNRIENLITDKTSAILPVHVYGNICNVVEIEKIANRYNLKVIYDAAHAFGEKYDGTGVGNFGDASMFSFHATKVFNTIEGGAVTFTDTELEKKLYQLKNFGIKSEDEVDGIGSNAKMNEFQAAMGICNLRHIDSNILERKRVFNRYTDRIRTVKGLRIVSSFKNTTSNYSYFPLIIDETQFHKTRDEVYKELKDRNIFSRKYFYPLTTSFGCYPEYHNKFDLPIAEYVSKRILTLPLYPDLTNQEVDKICSIIVN